MRYAFAGDRDIAVRVLDFLLDHGPRPQALLVSGGSRASHADALTGRCEYLPSGQILRGGEFREDAGASVLGELDLDLVVAVHFPYLIPPEILSLPRLGFVNLHPAYLPYNRGWHTVSWAILEETPIGGTLHFMDEGVDTGDIIHRKEVDPAPGDTADSLYERVKAVEFEVFREAWPKLLDGSFERTQQDPDAGTFHLRADLLEDEVQRIDLNEPTLAGELLRRLRALTTNRVEEAAFYEKDGRRFRVQVGITEEAVE